MFKHILSGAMVTKITSKIRRVEFQSLCEEQGIAHAWLRKADLVALLKEAEAGQVDNAT